MDTELAEAFERFRRNRALARSQFLQDITRAQEAIVSALDDVNAAVAGLTQLVNAAVTAIGNQGITSTEAETIVTEINGLAQQIDAALNPPPAPVG